jgi:pimeloyl-ACP methyl ester carboxylesterase
MWRSQVRALSSRYRVIVPELWGHGGSTQLPPDTHTLAGLARQMIEMLDRLGIARCVVVGSSVGGMWGAHLAALAPERVAGLVLMNSYLGEEPEGKRLAYAAMLDQVEAAGQVSDAVVAAITPLFFSADAEKRASDLPNALRQQLDCFSPEVLRRSIVPLGRMIFERGDALRMLSHIEAPVLIVAGEDDRARPPEESRRMANILDTELVVLGGCGHTATLERPEEVNAALLAFLEIVGWGYPGRTTPAMLEAVRELGTARPF